MKKTKRCPECNDILKNQYARRCWKCHIEHNKGMNHHLYKNGLSHCINCNRILSNYTGKRCTKCENKNRKVTRLNVNNPIYKNGFYCRNKKCIECNQHCSAGAIRCKSCNEHLNKLGKKNPQYIHGKGHLPYTKDFYKIRIHILKRDNHICQLCFKKGNTVHHIDYNQKNNNRNNLITVCLRCNIKVNWNRDYWYTYFTYIMEAK